MATNTTLISYALYDFNDKQGRVPFLDDATKRATLTTNLLGIVNVAP